MDFIVKNTTILNPLDLLAPHSCRGCGQIGCVLCNRCKNYITECHQDLCPNCKSLTKSHHCNQCPDLPPTFIIGERTDLLGQIVHDYKYHSVRALSAPLAELMYYHLPSIDGPVSIVPLPTINRHIRQRGFDHTLLIAKRLSKLIGKHCQVEPIIERAANTTQVGTDRTTRLSQATHAYAIAPNVAINHDTTYLLLDDVWTTGASMRACIKKLQQAGASKIIVAILSLSRIN